MDILSLVFVITCSILLALTLISFKFIPYFSIRTVVLVLFLAIMPLGFYSYGNFLGKPKPIVLELKDIGDVALLGFHYEENIAVWLWILEQGESEPVYYVLAWNKKLVEKIQQALLQLRGTNGSIMINGKILNGEFNDLEYDSDIIYVVPSTNHLPPKK